MEDPELALIVAPALPRRRGSDLLVGIKLLPERRLAAFSPDDLEAVVLHWLDSSVRPRYEGLIRYGGTGDKGRDVVGRLSGAPKGRWDNYQCKRYAEKLTPSAMWSEFGKLVYWVTEGTYTLPERYVFVAPRGVGAQGRDLLNDPEAIRRGLRRDWKKHCSTLCPYEEIAEALEAFVFPDFDVATAETIVLDLKDTPMYPVFFGGGLSKPRPEGAPPPARIADTELPYISRLVEAYDEHSDDGIDGHVAAMAHERYGGHLRESRRDFYTAEALRQFSKDVLVAPDDFDSLCEQLYDGVKNTIFKDFQTGYDRVLAVAEQASTVQFDDHPLAGDVRTGDRTGMCHQLANDGRVEWVRKRS